VIAPAKSTGANRQVVSAAQVVDELADAMSTSFVAELSNRLTR
jgi:hypothetical protein